jgi:hypothetical protein
MAFFDWDLGNGKVWRIPLEDPIPKKRMFKIKHVFLTEAEQAREDMRQYYAEVLKQPVPAAEEEFAAGMIEAEKNPPPPVVPEPVVHDENYIPQMPEDGKKDFFIWCSKTKKAREALKKKKEDEKAAAVAAKTAEKEAAAAVKAAAKSAKDAAKAEKEAAKAAKEAAKAAKEAAKAAKAK